MSGPSAENYLHLQNDIQYELHPTDQQEAPDFVPCNTLADKCCCKHNTGRKANHRKNDKRNLHQTNRKCLSGIKSLTLLVAFFGLASALAYVILKTRLLESRLTKLEKFSAMDKADSSPPSSNSNTLLTPNVAQYKELISQEIQKVSLHHFSLFKTCTLSRHVTVLV